MTDSRADGVGALAGVVVSERLRCGGGMSSGTAVVGPEGLGGCGVGVV